MRNLALLIVLLIVCDSFKCQAIRRSLSLNSNPLKALNTKLININQLKHRFTLQNNRGDLDFVASSQTKGSSLTIFELALCGAFASALADFVMHPVDTVKVFQQTAAVPVSLMNAAFQIFKKSGFTGFYTGVGPYVLSDGISGAIKFSVFEITKSLSDARLPTSLIPLGRFLCAAFAMLVCSVTLVPGEVIKVRLQEGSFGGMGMLIANTLKNEGIGGFFTGYFATLVRDVPYTMLELGLYENLKSLFRFLKRNKELSQSDELIAAALTGGITAVLTTPLDLVKTKLMIQSASGPMYSGVYDALHSIYAHGGFPALFIGATARIAWLLPFTMIYLPAYEFAKRYVGTIRRLDRI